MYTKKNFFKIVSYIIIYLSTLITAVIMTTSAQSKIFKIEDIEIYEPFNTNFNKEILINKAFSAAFKELTSSIITTKDQKKIKYTKLNEIKYLVDSFEIKDESFLNKKYIAKFNVNFNKKRTLGYFEKKNIFPSLKINKDFLTILIFIDNDNNQIFLYDKNPFYKNWNNNNKKFFFDVIYNPQKTNFLKEAEKNAHRIENGKMMFIYQAHQAFTLWHKKMPLINEEVINIISK